MFKRIIYKCIGFTSIILMIQACNVPSMNTREAYHQMPNKYLDTLGMDTTNSGSQTWKTYFTDPFLVALIDTALIHNQEFNITMLEIQIAKSEVKARKGEYLPFVGLGSGAGVEKTPRYTSKGANDANTDIKPGLEMPEPLMDYGARIYAKWEVDIWRKLRNARKAALSRYLASVEGRNFMQTNLVSEIANSYYELLALDNQLAILQKNITLQNSALAIVKLQKNAALVTELAVRRFEAQVLKTRSLIYAINQKIIETENRINFLVGRFPQPILRNKTDLIELLPNKVFVGIPSQLLANRPDIKQAELDLVAAKLDVKVARANFYPSLDISASLGLQAFNPSYLLEMPESMLYTLAGEIAGPLINRNAIKANYSNANAKQLKAIYHYEQTILNAYIEVMNQLSNIKNLDKSYRLKSKQVVALTESIEISNSLFKSARADYMEVLLTQREALESKFELIETKMQQMQALVNMYRALGGGWK